MTEPHAHRWKVEGPYSADDGTQYTDQACECGEVKQRVPEWRPPNQYHLTPKYQAMQKGEEL